MAMEGMSLRRSQVLEEEEKYVARLREHNAEKFEELCYMHLSFILNLSDDKLERILSEEEKKSATSSTRRKLAMVTPIFKKKEKVSGSLFGAPLSIDTVNIMTSLFKVLTSKDAICKEGIFRKPGNRQRMRTLREAMLETGPGYSIDTEVYTTHDVSGVLKEFLRELPEPLLTDKHMEAHLQIAVLGDHAQTPEDIARYNHKKICALQLLMLLLPTATSRMIMDVLFLLHEISLIPETKMTPDTLATIFAPIFFLNKKVSPLDMCDVVREVEPALSFMISNARKMFKAPRELAVDIRDYCKSTEGCDEDPAKVSQAYKIRKSISGRTLNTAVCYIDREQSQDSARTTQTELDSLFAHINSLPDTPANRRYKDMVAKNSCPGTPVSNGKSHSRSKSIGASLKKHLHSLAKSKSKSLDTTTTSISEGSATPYRDSVRRGVKHHRVNLGSKVMVVNCSEAKEKERPKSMPIVDYEKKGSPSNNATMLELLQSTGVRLSGTTKDIAESMLLLTSNQPIKLDRSPMHRRKRHSSDDTSAILDCTPQKQSCPTDQSVNKRSSTASTASAVSNSLRLPLSAVQKNDTPMAQNAKENSLNTKVNTPQEIKVKIANPASDLVPGSENEITYLPPVQHAVKDINAQQPSSTRRPLRSCNTPGTPVMPRTLLQLARSFSMETSI